MKSLLKPVQNEDGFIIIVALLVLVVLTLIGIAATGILMRYFLRSGVDIIAIKQLAVGLTTFNPVVPAHIGSIFYIHLFLVSCLLAYFPFSKLMHMGLSIDKTAFRQAHHQGVSCL